jgi:hypothetical protein
MTAHKPEFQQVRKAHDTAFFPNIRERGLQGHYQVAEVTQF